MQLSARAGSIAPVRHGGLARAAPRTPLPGPACRTIVAPPPSYSAASSSAERGAPGASPADASSSRASWPAGRASFGIFVCTGSPAAAEGLAHGGVDWLCLDMQHGAIGCAELAGMLQAMASAPRVRSIVRVGGPSDRFGMQQALDLGADGVLVPLVNTVQEAREAVSYCLYPPDGRRSVVYPARAVLAKGGAGPASLASYLKSANKDVQIWLQAETPESLSNLDAILSSVDHVDCMFLGPADMSVSMGLATQQYGGDLARSLAGPEMAGIHQKVLEACRRHNVPAGTFCVGAERAAQLAAQGFAHVGFDVDQNILINAATNAMSRLLQ